MGDKKSSSAMDEMLEGSYEFEETSITPIGGIDSFEGFDPRGYFGGEDGAQQARMAVAALKSWEEYLKASDKFAELACEFALKEAYVYIEISKFEDAESKLTEGKRNLVRWIRTKTSEEMTEILNEVAEGKRIHLIRRREYRERFKGCRERAADSEYKRISDSIVKQLTEKGYTSLTTSTFVEQWQSFGRPDSNTIKAYTESTRDKLIQRGGRGLGDSKGTYMMIEKCDRAQAAQMVKTRLESIVADLKVIKQICDKKHYVVPDEGVKIIVKLIESLRHNDDILDISV